MDETTARQIVAARAIETHDPQRVWWTDDDRAWASRAAAEIVGADAPPEAFLARRSALVLERAGSRSPLVARTHATLAWRRWLTPLVLALAFVAGLSLDQVATGGRINVLAPPVLVLLVWNFAVYAALAVSPWLGTRRGGIHIGTGSLRAALVRLATGAKRMHADPGIPARAMTAYARDWATLASPLYAARAARILHVAAATLAAGVIVGLYVRGLALEYRAGWESTFLGARQVHAVLALVLAPGSALTGIPVPDTAHVAGIRSDVLPRGENAALWVHLYAGTVVALVVIPRLVLAMLASLRERRREAALALDPAEPYARRVLRDFTGTPLAVAVAPYSYALPQPARAHLATALQRAFGSATRIDWRATTAYGGEEAALHGAGVADLTVAVFSATATPETESHAAFLHALRAGGHAVVGVVDDSGVRARWPDDPKRLATRHSAWQTVLAACAVPVLFADLSSIDAGALEQGLARVLEGQP